MNVRGPEKKKKSGRGLPKGLVRSSAREGDEGERNEEVRREREGRAREWGYCWEINNTT